MTSTPNTKGKAQSPLGWEALPPVQPMYPNQPTFTNPTYPVQPGYPIQAHYPVQAGYPVQPGYPVQDGYPGIFSGPIQTTAATRSSPYTIAVDRSEISGTPVYEPGNPPQSADPYNVESPKPDIPDNFGNSFSTKEIRHKFVRKVYIILTLQLLVTLGIVAAFTVIEGVQVFVRNNWWVYALSYAVFLITYLALICFSSARRKYPTNIILLTIFTLSMAYLLGSIASFHRTESVLLTIGITAAICFLITMFAVQTKIDFTGCSIYLFVATFVLLIFGIIALVSKSPTLHHLYSAGIVLIFSLYLIYDTQMLIGGKKYSLSPEEYIFGALSLYLDVVYIFLGVLGISKYN